MLHRFLSILFLISCLAAHAQQTYFEPGFVVMNNSDTLQGYVERLRDDKLAFKTHFKKAISDQDSTGYLPFEIKGFGFKASGIYFESVEYRKKTANADKVAQRFAKLMVAGYASLYKLELSESDFEERDLLLMDFQYVYILKKAEETFTLDQYINHNKEQHKDFIVPRYIGVLKLAFQNCPSSAPQLADLDFEDQDLIKATVNYNKCRFPDRPVTQTTFKDKTKWGFGVEGGLIARIKDEDRPKATGYSVTALARRFNLGENERAWTNLGLGFFALYYEKDGESARYTGLRIPIIINYFLTKKKQGPFFSAGVTASNKFFYLNAGLGLEYQNVNLGLMLETNPIRLASPKHLMFRAAYFLDKP
ncbi:MAG: hypothetical protein IT258_09305 [Saprospiraceae bacterium]|nr:hypothetical protein [Saprospiraceae bacterium]